MYLTNLPMIPVQDPVHFGFPVLFQDCEGKLYPSIWKAAKPLMWKSPLGVMVSNTDSSTIWPCRFVNAVLQIWPLGMLLPFSSGWKVGLAWRSGCTFFARSTRRSDREAT